VHFTPWANIRNSTIAFNQAATGGGLCGGIGAYELQQDRILADGFDGPEAPP